MANLKIIIVGGMIGVGKTSLIGNLCNQLKQKNYKVSVVYELWEDSQDNIFENKNTYDQFMDTIISLYYENIDVLTKTTCEQQTEYLLHKLVSHQIHFLTTRTTKVLTAINDAQNKNLDYLILDRSLYEDIVFTYLNLKQHPQLWQQYYNIWELWEAKLTSALQNYQTQHFILDAPIDVILKRITKRGREFEQGTEVFKYFKDLNQNYVGQITQEFKQKKISNYTIIDTQYNSSCELASDVINHYLGS